MANVLNYHSGQVLRGSTSVNLTFPFTPTSGSRLVAFIGCSSTFTMGSGWTKHLTGVAAIEHTVATKVSDGGEASVPVTLAVARSVAYTVIELRGGGTLSVGAAEVPSNMSGLPGSSENTLMWGLATSALNSTPAGTSTWTGTPTITEMADRLVPAQGGDVDDGLYQTVGYQEDIVTSMTASRTWATGPSGLNALSGWVLGYWNTPGGGGGTNTAPTANAGSDQTVNTGTLVTLNGSGSSDVDGTIASYAWTQTSGTAVTLSGSGATRTFTPGTAGVRTFQLTVTDDDGATGNDSVTITVNAPGGGNLSPTANAGPDQTGEVGTLVTISGSASSDPDGTIVSYAWSQISGPSASLSGSGATRTFTPSAAGTYTFQLTVVDSGGATGQDFVSIVISAPGSSLETIAQENAKTAGRFPPSYWFSGLSSLDLPSFPRSTYYLPGQVAQFSVNYNLPFTIRVFRLGHYGGDGAREVYAASPATPTAQPTPTSIPGGNGAVSCANWSVNATWNIPVDAQPGWYMAYFRNVADTVHGHALFCVSDKNNKKPTLIVASDATWHAAYNGYGGNNVYGADLAIGNAADRAFCSTYDKPVISINYVPQTHFYNNTYPYLKFSERMGIDAGVTTIEQIKNDPTILDDRDVIVWTGHNEYVPQGVINKVKTLLTSGANMVNIAGNDMFWRVKFTNGGFSSTTNGRVMWCKKDSLAGPTTGPDAVPAHTAGTPFTTEADWTGTWQDTRWSLREPSYAYFGDQFVANGVRNDAVTVPSSMKALPPWRNCAGVQALGIGQSLAFAAGTLGMEWDEPHPSTTLEYVNFSSTDIVLTFAAADENGAIYNVSKTGQHRFMMMKSGNSYVANFNSDQWGWALDSLHLRGSTAPNVNAQQMMLNVLYDLGSQGNGGNITTAGLTIPTTLADFATAYGLPPVNPTTPPGGGGGSHITVLDTPTLNLTLSGDGSAESPYVLSGVASPELGYSQSTRMYYSDGVKWHEL
jgi:hypothetical protein